MTINTYLCKLFVIFRSKIILNSLSRINYIFVDFLKSWCIYILIIINITRHRIRSKQRTSLNIPAHCKKRRRWSEIRNKTSAINSCLTPHASLPSCARASATILQLQLPSLGGFFQVKRCVFAAYVRSCSLASFVHRSKISSCFNFQFRSNHFHEP